DDAKAGLKLLVDEELKKYSEASEYDRFSMRRRYKMWALMPILSKHFRDVLNPLIERFQTDEDETKG
ncbi:MAG TPA: hypothetical protein DF383_02730, partial [Deltaproteobacteria bacterium]|nr:hypothetical protein [Deltaproteobacteria bacterium]